ncbi:hypothetical protein LSTR_LSTR006246 [Laodelphax striatellus]|uniref:Uncharacterized protein n=1 Tax=Laodelphax striatellus TaxID=195883 RepID=A0A482XS38_LAOST|nr:hypothetical protein LSTR_LSTR006245 [Laodelphax striatellus]RZF48279.1 hypothetical protein LSTR_LSTR006246 [Laodelphax striatellus]
MQREVCAWKRHVLSPAAGIWRRYGWRKVITAEIKSSINNYTRYERPRKPRPTSSTAHTHFDRPQTDVNLAGITLRRKERDRKRTEPTLYACEV